jgi:hypothetical protein
MSNGRLSVLIVLLVAGCMCYPARETVEASTTTLPPGNASSNRTANISLIPDVTSIGEALFMWKPYQCNYTNQIRIGEKIRTEMCMDRGKYHALVNYGRGKTNVLNDGVFVYVWDDGKPTPGTKYEISDITGLREHIESSEIKANRSVAICTDLMDILTATNITCKPAVLPEDVFTPPKKTFERGRGVYDYQYDSKLDKYAKNST